MPTHNTNTGEEELVHPHELRRTMYKITILYYSENSKADDTVISTKHPHVPVSKTLAIFLQASGRVPWRSKGAVQRMRCTERPRLCPLRSTTPLRAAITVHSWQRWMLTDRHTDGKRTFRQNFGSAQISPLFGVTENRLRFSHFPTPATHMWTYCSILHGIDISKLISNYYFICKCDVVLLFFPPSIEKERVNS